MATARPSPVRAFFLLIVLLTACIFSAAAPANAQNRGIIMRAPVQVQQTVRVAPARPQAAHTVSAVPAVRSFSGAAERSQNRTVTGSFPRTRTDGNRAFQNRQFGCANGTSVQQLLSPAPSYGFNYEYLNAIDKDLNVKAAIDPATQLALREAARYGCTGFVEGGYIIWDGGGYVPAEQTEEQPQESAPAPQPQVVVVQVPTATQTPSARVPTTAQPDEEQAPPLPDIGQFTLVRRDGTQLKAAAFTRSNDQIIYITPDGMRHTMAVGDLDTDATIRVNSERGSQLQLSL